MISAGDEFGRTQQGNNNAYCQDNEVSWLDWDKAESNKDLLRFFKRLIEFRRSHTLFRQREFIGQGSHQIPKIIWHGVQLQQPDWSWHSKSIAVELQFDGQDADLFFMFNAYSDQLTFRLPAPAKGKRWYRLLDTSLESPYDIADSDEEKGFAVQDSYAVVARSLVGLIQR
jgi:glycogen operon protein